MADAYQLLDVGGGARLEQFGDRVTDRPYPAALGARADPGAWAGADLRFDRDRGWTGAAAAREPWPVTIEGVTLELRATDAGQVGLFPEHAAMLPWLGHEVARRTREPARRGRSAPGRAPPVRLHRPGHAGAVAAGAPGHPRRRVAAGRGLGARQRRRGPGWPTRRSAGSSTTRVAFTGREIRRGRRYAGVILDPPSYGHGPGTGQPGSWSADLPALLDACAEVLEPDGFMLLTAHTEGFDGDRLAHDLAAATRRPAASMEAGDLALATPDGRVLRLGAFARSAGRA